MSRHLCLALLALLSLPAVSALAADGRTLAPGFVPQGEGPAAPTRDRNYLINDGSFENGTCLDGHSDWTCYADNDCDWIVDLSTLGLPTLGNYDGDHSYWLGGFCENQMSSDRVCQTIDLYGPELEWLWAGYVTSEGDLVTFTVDGNVVFSHTMTLADHTAEGTNGSVWKYQSCVVWDFAGGPHELCLEYSATVGANYFVDYIESYTLTPTEETSFSVVKSRY